MWQQYEILSHMLVYFFDFVLCFECFHIVCVCVFENVCLCVCEREHVSVECTNLKIIFYATFLSPWLKNIGIDIVLPSMFFWCFCNIFVPKWNCSNKLSTYICLVSVFSRKLLVSSGLQGCHDDLRSIHLRRFLLCDDHLVYFQWFHWRPISIVVFYTQLEKDKPNIPWIGIRAFFTMNILLLGGGLFFSFFLPQQQVCWLNFSTTSL